MTDLVPSDDERALLRARAEQILDDHVDGVYSYCSIMLRSAERARAASRNALTAALVDPLVRVDEAESADNVRTVIFAHARNEVRQVSRGAPSEPDDKGSEPVLRDLVLDEVEGFGERDKDLMALSIVEGLDDHAVSVVTGVEESHLPDLLRRMRRRVESAVGPLLLVDTENEEFLELGALASLLAIQAPDDLAQGVLEGFPVHDVHSPESPTPPKTRELGESAKLAMYGLVALAVGLLGSAISAQFDPLEHPPRLVGAAPGPVPATTTTTEATESPTTTTGTAPSSTAGSNSGGAVALAVSDGTIDFGEDGTSGEFDIVNEGADAASFTVETSSDAISLSSGSGELAAGESATYQVSLDRDQLAEGPLDERIVISWDGSSLEIEVVGVHEDNPVLHNPGASPATVRVDEGRSCSPTQTTVAVRVRDTSRLESVIARWSPDGGGTRETDMIAVGNDIYEAVIGPFTSAQTAEVRLVATDEFGNAGGASVTINVEDCS